MLEPSVQLMKEKADSRYTLAMLAAKRARDIIDGKPVLIDIDIDKPVSIAVHEIAENLITFIKEKDNNCLFDQPLTVGFSFHKFASFYLKFEKT